MTKWWLIGAGGFLAALLIVSIVLALTSRETVFAPGTPERAVQDLLRSAEDDDIEAAYAMLSEELHDKCELTDYAGESRYRAREDWDIRATLRDSELIDDTTFVNVQITQFRGGGPFDSGESSYNRRYTLRQEDGEWKFTQYPWPYDYCPETEEEE
ncbi:MAG: hypothetical protein F4Y44_00940 [Chloroflexi bacterium]|nr:hypothetical protein [Chloroflexota bacterium]